MKIKKKPDEIWREYQKCKEYNESIDLYERVKQNENFFLGNQWEGINAPDMDKPVLNFLKRVVTFFVSIIASNSVGVSVTPNIRDEQHAVEAQLLTDAVNVVIEDNSLIQKGRDFVRDMAVAGDTGCYFYYDADKATVVSEILDSTRILFGNPFIYEVQRQPYIILEVPMITENVKELAKQEGVSEYDASKIEPDDPELQKTSGYEQMPAGAPNRTVLLIKMWKDPKTGTIHFTKTTKDIVIVEDTDTKYSIYPIAYATWEKKKDTYHGQSVITGLIPSQIATNKLRAMQLYHLRMSAFPVRYYNKQLIPHWPNNPGLAIGINGPPKDAISIIDRPGEMSNQVSQVCDEIVQQTKELMGASDAALGQVKPENTSAILANQKASSAPLELQRITYKQFMEDCIRIIIEILTKDDIPRMRTVIDESGEPAQAFVDLTQLDINQLNIKVDIGESAYWDELMQNQTMESLFLANVIPPELFVKGIPDSRINNKAEILKFLAEQKPVPGEEALSDDGAMNENNMIKQQMSSGSVGLDQDPRMKRAQNFIQGKNTRMGTPFGVGVGANNV